MYIPRGVRYGTVRYGTVRYVGTYVLLGMGTVCRYVPSGTGTVRGYGTWVQSVGTACSVPTVPVFRTVLFPKCAAISATFWK